MNKSEIKDESVEFLLHEFDNMETERARLKNEAVQRLNFFLTITSGILGGIALFGQYAKTKPEFLFLPALIFLSIIGWQTFDFMIGRDINIDRILRAIGRIRRYFSDNDPAITPYLYWQADDEPSILLSHNRSFVRRTTQSVLAFLLALIIALFSAFFLTIETKIIIVSGIVSFFALVVTFEVYAKNKLKQATKKAQTKILHPRLESSLQTTKYPTPR